MPERGGKELFSKKNHDLLLGSLVEKGGPNKNGRRFANCVKGEASVYGEEKEDSRLAGEGKRERSDRRYFNRNVFLTWTKKSRRSPRIHKLKGGEKPRRLRGGYYLREKNVEQRLQEKKKEGFTSYQSLTGAEEKKERMSTKARGEKMSG